MLDFLSFKVENSPKMGGLAHLLILALYITLIVLVCVFLRKTNDKQHKIILLFVGFWLLLFEIFKQIMLIYDCGNFQYDWQHLPLQPCSSLMYTIILTGFLSNVEKAKKFNSYLYSFISIYGFFSGASAVVMPSAIFNTSYLFLLIQSVQHHMLLSLLAIYIFVRGYTKIHIKSFLKGGSVFLVWCGFALILNSIIGSATNNPEINMMYMGPFTIWPIPLVSSFFEITSIWLYIPFYLFIYSSACLLSIYIYWSMEFLVKFINKKVIEKKQAKTKPKVETQTTPSILTKEEQSLS